MGSFITALKTCWAQMKANLGRISSSPDRRLERQLEAELHFAGIAIARNPAKGSARLGGVHPEGVRVVEQIEGLGAELEAHLLGDPEILVNGEVHAPEARPIDTPTAGPSGAGIRANARGRADWSERRRVQPARVRLEVRTLRAVRVADGVRPPAGCTGGDVVSLAGRIEAGGDDGQRQSGVRIDDTRGLPATEQGAEE